MKIVVISYDELNKRPSKEQVIEDIIYYSIDKASGLLTENLGSVLRGQLKELKGNPNSASVVFMDTSDLPRRNNLEQFVKEQIPDLLVSYNLAGFELGTLTDSLLYNLLNCRQFHFITKKPLSNEQFLDKLMSINMFIFDCIK